MAAKLFLNERELRGIGMSEANLRTLRKLTEFVNTQTELAAAQAEIDAAQTTISDQGDAIDAANTDIATANAAINTLDGRIDAYDALAPFVRQDQVAAPAFSAYAGQTVSAAYVQAEAQATDNAAKANAIAIAALITALQAANVLT